MFRSLLFAVVWGALAIAAWSGNVLIWVPLSVVAGYNIFRAMSGSRPVAIPKLPVFPENVPLGELGHYTVDGDRCLGMFLQLNDDSVFVDLREDRQLEARRQRALELAQNVEKLSANLAAWRSSQPEFASRKLTYIGIHAPKVQECELFWEPNGHTRLRGLEFTSD